MTLNVMTSAEEAGGPKNLKYCTDNPLHVNASFCQKFRKLYSIAMAAKSGK
jgi:hypothetical protein